MNKRKFWPGPSFSNVYKATEDLKSDSTKNPAKLSKNYPGRYALNQPNSRRSEHGILLLQQLGLIINSHYLFK